MFCKNCGKEIDDKASVCVYCGVVTDNLLHRQAVTPDVRTNGFAIAGFVLTLIGIFCGYFTYDVVPLLGLIFSIIGLAKSKTYGSGRGLSIAGIVISLISVIFCILLIAVLVPFILSLVAAA